MNNLHMYQLLKNEELLLKVLTENTILKVITGSTLYGLNRETSDIDEKSVVILPKELYFQMDKEFETKTFHSPDTEFHTLKKFMNLANTQNPTILEMLYAPDSFVVKDTKYSQILRDNRELFLSLNCFNSFGGYAREQLMRIKSGLNKVTMEDKNEHLEFTINRLLESFPDKYNEAQPNAFQLLNVSMNDDGKQSLDVSIHYDKISIQQLYGMVSEVSNTTRTYNKVNNRNKKPADKLEKHAMHLIRLLKMGVEVLLNGYLEVNRSKDREFLLNVRDGKYTWDEIFEIVANLNEDLKQAKEKTFLPKETDYQKIHTLYSDIMLDWLTAA